jgi:hypothetical protein
MKELLKTLYNIDSLSFIKLSDKCYSHMFYGCTDLEEGPIELPATELKSSCYNYMFSDCSNLKYIEAWFDSEPSYKYTNSWVQNVAKDGVFLISSNTTWNPEEYRGINGIPEGWTVETT